MPFKGASGEARPATDEMQRHGPEKQVKHQYRVAAHRILGLPGSTCDLLITLGLWPIFVHIVYDLGYRALG